MQDDLQRQLKQAQASAEQALLKIELIREGLVDELKLRQLGGRSMVLLYLWREQAAVGNGISFHRPSTQQYTHISASGRNSFTFLFSSVTKLPLSKKARRSRGATLSKATTKPKKLPRQSKPVDHANYIERSDAVATSPAILPTAFEIPTVEGTSHVKSNLEQYSRLADALFDGPALELDIGSVGSNRWTLSDGPGDAVQDLSVSNVDGASGRPAEGSLQADAAVGGAERSANHRMRWVAPEPVVFYDGFLNSPPSEALREDWYIDRPGAVAVQPDGTRALLTNIDPDPVKRAEFWQLVEEHERESKSDRMSINFGDDPAFWGTVIKTPACPLALRSAYQTADHAKVVQFEIESVSEMQKFLGRQQGWIKKGDRPMGVTKKDWDRQGPASQATFQPGRNGRTQYRLIGQLPHEAGADGCLEILREFTRELETRRFPFVAVVHEPDHHNDDKNWHFHIIFYDRPCSRVREAQIRAKAAEGIDVGAVAVGDWDFATQCPVPGRKKRSNYPFRQKKVRSVAVDDSFIDKMRAELAKVTNDHLQRRGLPGRFDPRTFAEMGIPADPQEHLGTTRSARELVGDVTEMGVKNEAKQDRAIRAELKARRAEQRRMFGEEVQIIKKAEGFRHIDGLAAVRQAKAAIELDYNIAIAEHEIRRAKSRAQKIFGANKRVLDAARVSPRLISPREVGKRSAIMRKAADYLEMFDEAFFEEITVLSKNREKPNELLAEAYANLRSPATGPAFPPVDELSRLREAEAPQPVSAGQVAIRPVGEDFAPTKATFVQPPTPELAHHATSRGSALPVTPTHDWKWLDQIAREMPLIVIVDKKLAVHGRALPQGWDGAAAQEDLRQIYEVQRGEISELADRINQDPSCVRLRRGATDPSLRFELATPALKTQRRFDRYQDDPELAAAIREAMVRQAEFEQLKATVASNITPPVACSDERPIEVEATLPSAPRSPTSMDEPRHIEIEPIAKAVPTVIPETRDIAPPPPVVGEAEPSAPMFNFDDFINRIARGELRLTLDADDKVPPKVLINAGVPLDASARLREQTAISEYARLHVEEDAETIFAHVRENPLLLDPQFLRLSEEAPEELQRTWAFHRDAPLFMMTMKRLIEGELGLEVDGDRLLARRGDREAVEPKRADDTGAQNPLPDKDRAGEAARRAALRALQELGG